MFHRKHAFLVLVLVVILALAGTGGAVAAITVGSGDDDDQTITGSALEECTAAALADYPGGAVTETEVGDDGAAYEVEVRLEDGTEVEVHLNENCQIIGHETDDDGPNDHDGADDDDGPDDD